MTIIQNYSDYSAGWFPNWERGSAEFFNSIIQTLQMTFGSFAISFVLGIFFGVALVVTRKGGIMQNLVLYNILDKAVNTVRSVPFLILMVVLFPLSRLIVGTALGVPGAIIPLVFGTVPFFSRQVEVAISEVDRGLIEASTAMGLSAAQIIFRVYLRESIPSIARVTQVTIINLIGLTVIAGAVGAGGLGDFAIRFGVQRAMTDLMWISILAILIIVNLIQGIGNVIIKKTSH